MRYFYCRPPVSRVLSRTIIYLACLLPSRSSGYRFASGSLLCANLLAVDRVYLLSTSPWIAVSSYRASRIASSAHQARHSFHLFPREYHKGSFVSVALSLGLPPVAVSDCRYPSLPGLSSWYNLPSDCLADCRSHYTPEL